MLCGLLFGFDTILTEIKKKREKITSANRLSDQNFWMSKVRPQALRIKNQFKKGIFFLEIWKFSNSNKIQIIYQKI